jgi:hypothetical protein
MKYVESKLYNGIRTDKIFKYVFHYLNKLHPHSASRFDLKRAVMRIGPAGYPFETFFAEILQEYGYKTKLRQIVQGRCIPHEVDVVAENQKNIFMVECKYHNNRGTKSHIIDALYTWGRFLDLMEGAEEGKCENFKQPWLATNTKFTSEVVEYGVCRGLKLTGWNYPKTENLRHMIESRNLYPISVLKSVDKYSTRRLFNADLMLARDVIKFSVEKLQTMTKISRTKLETITEEARGVLRVDSKET